MEDKNLKEIVIKNYFEKYNEYLNLWDKIIDSFKSINQQTNISIEEYEKSSEEREKLYEEKDKAWSQVQLLKDILGDAHLFYTKEVCNSEEYTELYERTKKQTEILQEMASKDDKEEEIA